MEGVRGMPVSLHFLPLLEDFSPRITLDRARVGMALQILLLTGHAGMSRWKPGQIYTNAGDPLYQTLYRMMCVVYHEHLHHANTITGKYNILV